MGEVVLNKAGRDVMGCKFGGPIRLEEKAAVVGKTPGLDKNEFWDL
jgi:hypothetical protein